MNLSLEELRTLCQRNTDAIFRHYLIKATIAAPLLQEVMAYAVFNGGKRLRPLLVYATGHVLNAPWDNLDIPAAAIELIHAYSLVHDDLPAMDNSNLRRGKPTCHKIYGDAMAILAGDSLQTLAFDILSSHPAEHLWPFQRLTMIETVTNASGFLGMAAGQTLDLSKIQTLDELTSMYQLKTGMILSACIKLGLIAANVNDSSIITALENYARCIGLAYQIQDDLLDVEGDTKLIGKPNGIDKTNEKITYVSLAGIERSKQKVNELFDSAISSLPSSLGGKNEILLELANYILQRKM